MNIKNFSDYIVYVDESGDHALSQTDPVYPVFVLSFCIFHKKHYVNSVVPALQHFKIKHFGYDNIILHEHEIRKEEKLFRFENREQKNIFLNEISTIIHNANFILINCVIDKRKLRQAYKNVHNPYYVALKFCLERLYLFLKEKQQQQKITHINFESRGKKEDKELELEFYKTCRANIHNCAYPFEFVCINKKSNSSGLQIADLTARPIGLSVYRPEQNNRAFDILRNKFYCKGGREAIGSDYMGYGLKVFP